MADKKASRKKKKKEDPNGDQMTKDETAVAKYMRFNLPAKKTTFYGEQVEYFIGSKAVDFLMESKWANGKAPKSKVQFTDRESVIEFLDRLLVLGTFSRVQRIKKDIKKVDKKAKDGVQKDGSSKNGSPKEVRKRKPDKTVPKEGKEEVKDGKKKRKVKYTLEAHEEQFFIDDDDEAFMWIYDPVHPWTFFYGVLLVLGVIACCLFPLWPDNVRVYSWYTSVAIAICIGGLFAVGLLRYVVFAFVWALTFGKISFWFLPNLTAECGFFESFKPGYQYECRSSTTGPAGEELTPSSATDLDKEQPSAEVTSETIEDQTIEDNNSSGKESHDTDAETDLSWVKVKSDDAPKTTTEDC